MMKHILDRTLHHAPRAAEGTAAPGCTRWVRRRVAGRILSLALAAVMLVPVAAAADVRREGWLDLNKNGTKDIYEDPAAALEARIDDLLGRMTLEEKLAQLAQYNSGWQVTGPKVTEAGEAEVRAGQVGSFLNARGAAVTRDIQRVAVEQTRLGIPLLFALDVIHGYRTIFPVPLAEASSWNLEAMERAARIAAVEASAHGIHWTFAPMVDIARDPRWGRIVEGAGEDPHLGSRVAAARVRGFQGDLRGTDTLLACAKHFAAYGAAEAGRDYNPADISERTLYEVYLPPFKAALDAGARTLMPAFNDIAGIPCHAHHALLTEVLRESWGFDGLVVSDWDAIGQLRPHGVAATREDAGTLALRAGVDIDMVSGIFGKDMIAAVRAGRVPAREVDVSVRRVLRAKFERGLFDDPYRFSDPAREKAVTLTAEHRAAARAMARESIVLLKNERRTLPLSRSLRSLAVIGPLADDRNAPLGPWAAAGRAEDVVTVLAGVRQAVGEGTRVRHARGAGVTGEDRSGFAEATRLAREADAVLLVLGEDAGMSGEAHSRTSLDLPGVQEELARAVKEAAAGKPVVVVLMNGRPLALVGLDETMPAILETWFLGVETGHAVADVLFGDHNPGGKLPVTFPRNLGQVPLYHSFRNTGRPPDPDDPFTSRYLDVHWTPLYVFGHGLSYTSFAYGGLKLSADSIAPDAGIVVEVEVRNTGDRAGDEVVQLYLRDEVGSTTRPMRELRGFARVRLEAGAARRVSFQLTPDDLACYNRNMERVVEPGFFSVFVGGSSAAGLAGRFEVVAAKAPEGQAAGR